MRQIENDITIYNINKRKNRVENKENISINRRPIQINNKYMLYEEIDDDNKPPVPLVYEILEKGLIENETLQKNLIESFIYNIIIEYLFNNNELNSDIYSPNDENDIFNNLYIDKNGFLYLIKDNNYYLSTDNSINNKFKLNEKLKELLVDSDISSDSFMYLVDLIIYYICEIKKYYYTFENYINVYLDGTRPLNWCNKFKDWVIYSLQERFFLNKTDKDINNSLKNDIYEINKTKNSSFSKFMNIFDSLRGKFHRNKFN